MRHGELPRNPEALRPILEGLNRYLEHYDKIELELSLDFTGMGLSKDTRLAAIMGDPEAKRRQDEAIQRASGTNPWLRARIDALDDLMRGIPPIANMFMTHIDYPFTWADDGSPGTLSFEEQLQGWFLTESIADPSFLIYPRPMFRLARMLRLEIMGLLDAALLKVLSQDRLRATPAGDDSIVTLDGVKYSTPFEPTLFLDALIQADGERVAFTEFQRSHPELTSSTGTRVIKKLHPKIRQFIECAQGKEPRLRVELLR